MISMIQILKLAKEKGASDIHITSNSPPVLRVNGQIHKVNVPPLKPEETKQLCYSLISNEQKAHFESKKNLDFSFYAKGLCRVRGSIYLQKTAVVGAFRMLSSFPPQLESLGLPPVLNEISGYPHGLVLVTGPTGAGKSTTLAACIDKINNSRCSHILTLEDPIEFIYQHNKSIVNQREMGTDCLSFADGLRSAMRSDPDICLVGEIRDRETVELTLQLAETGHLVFSTLHTNTAAKSVDRILGMFDQDNRTLVQNQLSTVIQAVISQRLVLTQDGQGRKVAVEVMLANPAIRNLIRENKIFQIHSVIQTNVSEGMTTLNNSLVQLLKKGEISRQEAFRATSEKEELYRLLKGKKAA